MSHLRPRRVKRLLSLLRLGPEYPYGSRLENKEKKKHKKVKAAANYGVVYRGGKQPPNPPPPPKLQTLPPIERNYGTVYAGQLGREVRGESEWSSPIYYRSVNFACRFGVYAESGQGYRVKVSEVRENLTKTWKMPTDASAYVGVTKVSDEYEMQDGELLEFHKRVHFGGASGITEGVSFFSNPLTPSKTIRPVAKKAGA